MIWLPVRSWWSFRLVRLQSRKVECRRPRDFMVPTKIARPIVRPGRAIASGRVTRASPRKHLHTSGHSKEVHFLPMITMRHDSQIHCTD